MPDNSLGVAVIAVIGITVFWGVLTYADYENYRWEDERWQAVRCGKDFNALDYRIEYSQFEPHLQKIECISYNEEIVGIIEYQNNRYTETYKKGYDPYWDNTFPSLLEHNDDEVVK